MLIRKLSVLASICLASTTLLAADHSMIGKWKLNPEKSKMTGLDWKFEDLGGDKFNMTFGDDTETIFTDGKAHPAKYGGKRTVTKEGPSSWKVVRTRDGKVTSTSTWTISEDGKNVHLDHGWDAGRRLNVQLRFQSQTHRRDIRPGRNVGKHRDETGLPGRMGNRGLGR